MLGKLMMVIETMARDGLTRMKVVPQTERKVHLQLKELLLDKDQALALSKPIPDLKLETDKLLAQATKTLPATFSALHPSPLNNNNNNNLLVLK
jgi:hypothetical protein